MRFNECYFRQNVKINDTKSLPIRRIKIEKIQENFHRFALSFEMDVTQERRTYHQYIIFSIIWFE